MFGFAEETKNMNAVEMLNYYRNLYYAEPQVTEHGIVANAINDVLPNMVEVVRCKDCIHSRQGEWYTEKLYCAHQSHMYSQVPFRLPPEHFCSYGERKDNETS